MLSKNTLEYEINVPVRLLNSKNFSHRYTLISDSTFIKLGFSEIQIFQILNLWTVIFLFWKVAVKPGTLNLFYKQRPN